MSNIAIIKSHSAITTSVTSHVKDVSSTHDDCVNNTWYDRDNKKKTSNNNKTQIGKECDLTKVHHQTNINDSNYNTSGNTKLSRYGDHNTARHSDYHPNHSTITTNNSQQSVVAMYQKKNSHLPSMGILDNIVQQIVV